ncbi:hypothetical protein AAVH_42163, partial [Aphelenchoides avenae]
VRLPEAAVANVRACRAASGRPQRRILDALRVDREQDRAAVRKEPRHAEPRRHRRAGDVRQRTPSGLHQPM